MELLQPLTWSEALEAKAEHPEAMPLWGGTDVMVELNFGRSRPETIVDLTRVRELDRPRARGRPDPRRRRRLVHARDRGARRRAAGAGDRLADRRLAADPQPRDDRGQPRLLLPRRRRAAAAVRIARGGRGRVHAGDAADRRRGLHHRPEAERARARRADRGVRRRPREGRAAVQQDRHAQRDGHRRLLVRGGHRRRGPHRRHLPRVGGADAAARPRGRGLHRGGARLGRRTRRSTTRRCSGSASSSPRPPRRSTTSAAARPTAAMRSR